MDNEKTHDDLKDRFPHHPGEAAYFSPTFHQDYPEAWHAYHQPLRPSLQVRIIFNEALKRVSQADFVEEDDTVERTKIERREAELLEALFFHALGEVGRISAAKAMKRYDKLFKTFAYQADYPAQLEQAKQTLARLIAEIATDDPRKSLVKKTVKAFQAEFSELLDPVAEAIETLGEAISEQKKLPALTRIRVMNLLARSVTIEPELIGFVEEDLKKSFEHFQKAALSIDWDTVNHDKAQHNIESTIVPLMKGYAASLTKPKQPFHTNPIQADYYFMQMAIVACVLDTPLDWVEIDSKVLRHDDLYRNHIEALLRYGIARPLDQENLPESQYNYLSDRGYHRFPAVHASRFNQTLEKVAELLVRDIHGLRE